LEDGSPTEWDVFVGYMLSRTIGVALLLCCCCICANAIIKAIKESEDAKDDLKDGRWVD